jgi:succinate dehydrogenase/fumarate reductase cytochrome b subunit
VLLLAAAAGVADMLHRVSGRVPTALFWAVVLGVVLGMLLLYMKGALLRWTGRWLGGKASGEQVRAALAWSGVPVIFSLLLWLPALALFGEELFATEMPRLYQSPRLIGAFAGLALLHLVVDVWSFLIYLHCLGQVQQFSATKALLNTALSIGVAMFVVLPLGFILYVGLELRV